MGQKNELQIDLLEPDGVFVKHQYEVTPGGSVLSSYAPRFLKTKGKRTAQHHGPGIRVVTTDKDGKPKVLCTAKLQVNITHNPKGEPVVSYDVLQFEE